jgi:hypothetical protein
MHNHEAAITPQILIIEADQLSTAGAVALLSNH